MRITGGDEKSVEMKRGVEGKKKRRGRGKGKGKMGMGMGMKKRNEGEWKNERLELRRKVKKRREE